MAYSYPIPSSFQEPEFRRLHNEDWGFDSNCFVCEPRNDGGLRIPFHHDTVRHVVVANFSLGNRFSGAPSYLHGGVTLAVLDEAMAWATIAVGGKFAMTSETSTRFLRPIRLDSDYTVEASLTSQSDTEIQTEAKVYFGEGKICAEAAATFVVLGEAQAVCATGADASSIDPSLLR